MKIGDYFWDLPEDALKETERILKIPEHPDFPKKIIRVLTRNDRPKDIFTFITKEQFTEVWPKIRREWKRTSEAPDYYAKWERVYELLEQKKGKNKRIKGAPAEENQVIGRKIKQAREQKGWTQADLARRTGLKQPDISALEKGKKNITIATLAKLEKILELGKLPEQVDKKAAEMPLGPQQNFQLDGIQRQVYEDLKELAGPGAEAFYWDICWIRRNGGELKTRSHLLGHLLREIESSIRDVLRLYLDIEKKQGEHDAHKKEIERLLKELTGEREEDELQWFVKPGTLQKIAHRDRLDAPRMTPSDLEKNLSDMDVYLKRILHALRNHSSGLIAELDKLLEKDNPTSKDAEKLYKEIPDVYFIRKYFFERCSNPKWLARLKDTSVFRSPPELLQNEDGSITFPFWAESGYLVRMAKIAPQAVADIILIIPDTQNVYVIDGLVKATLNLPIDIAMSLIDKAAKWMVNEYLFYPLDKHLAELVLYYTLAGKAEEAFGLAKKMLVILPDPRWQKSKENAERYWDGPHPKTRVEISRYKEITEKIIPELAKSTGVPVFRWLCEMLDMALRYSQAKDEEPENNNDYSFFWRPEIEKPMQYEMYELRNILIDLILKTGTQLDATIGIDVLVKISSEKPWMLFKRIALHLLSLCPGSAPELTDKYLSDKALFASGECWDEYGPLLEKGFGFLPQDKQAMILKWVEDGPDFDKRYRKPGKDEAEQVRRHWQRDCLARFGQALPAAWQPYYTKLVQEYGVAEKKRNTGVVVEGGWESSPKTLDELAALPIEKLVEFLNAWKPSAEVRDVSAEGLAQMLSSLVQARPELYSVEARQFTRLTSPYTSNYLFWILFGFKEVIRNTNTKLEWASMLELGQWMRQSREIKEENADDRGQARGEIADCLVEGMRKNLIPLKLRKSVWTVLEPLTEDSDPTSEYENTHDMEPYSRSINSTRGKAMHAVMNYMWWIYRNKIQSQTDDFEEDKREEMMPEIEKILDKHLDHTQDSSLAIHSVYGRWFPWLAKVKPEWSAKARTRIFPEDEREREYWAVAWKAYILLCQPYDNVFEILKTEYARAVNEIEDVAEEKDKRLAWHLMLFYIRGKLELESDIFINFWKRAPDELRGTAMQMIGFDILGSTENLSAMEMQRIKKMWEKRCKMLFLSTSPEIFLNEMSAFGHWFGSGKCDSQWAIDQLLFVLEKTKHIEAIPPIMEQLKTMVETYPTEVVKILVALAENEINFIAFHQDEIMAILESVFSKNHQASKKRAEEFCNYLLSKGFMEFRNILQKYSR